MPIRHHQLFLATALSLLAVSCAPADQHEGEDVVSISAPLVACTSTLQSGCWGSWSGPNFRAFDIGPKFECAQLYPQPTDRDNVMCFQPKGSTGNGKDDLINYTPGWGHSPSGQVPGGGIKSVAVRVPFPTDAAVWVLSEDNITYGASGDLAKFYTAPNFQYFTVRVPAKDTNGAALCMKKIANIVLPSGYAPNIAVIGLSCSGAIYAAVPGTGWRPAASAGKPWSQIPTGYTWADISHGPLGAYLLTSTGAVFFAGGGSVDLSGNTTWINKWLSSLPSGLKGEAVGGPFVRTNAVKTPCLPSSCPTCLATSCNGDGQRVYRWNDATASWSTLPFEATPFPTGVPTSEGSPWIGDIVDGSSFRGQSWSYALWHKYSRVYVYVP